MFKSDSTRSLRPFLIALLLSSTAVSAMGQDTYFRYQSGPGYGGDGTGGIGTNTPPPQALSANASAYSNRLFTDETPYGGIDVTGAALGPVTFAATGLPVGISISDAGRLIGRPLGTGTFSARITVTDALGRQAHVDLPFEVLAPGSVPRVTFAEPPLSFLQEGSTTTFAATSDLQDPTWTLEGASPGSSVSPQGMVTLVGGDVSGTTSYNARLTATREGVIAFKDFSYGVVPSSASFGAFRTARVSGPFSVPVSTAMGTVGTWTLEGAPGFSGIAFSPPQAASTTLAGTAPAVADTYRITARFTAPNGATVSASGDQVVAPAFRIGSLGGPYQFHLGGQPLSTQAPAPTGLLGSATYAVQGTPFDGTRFEQGRIVGTPTETGTRSFTVTMRDGYDGGTSAGDLSVSVLPPLGFTTQPMGALVYPGSTVSVTGVAAPAIGALSYRLLALSGNEIEDIGVPCPGLGFSRGQGIVSGVATASCSLPGLRLRAADSTGATATSDAFSLTGETPTASVVPSGIDIVEGDVLEFQATSNIPNATFSIAASQPALPGYVTISPDGLVRVRTGDHVATTTYSVTVQASNGTMGKNVVVPVRIRASTLSVSSVGVHSGLPFSVTGQLDEALPSGAAWSIGGLAGVTVSDGASPYTFAGVAPTNTGSSVVNQALQVTRVMGEAPTGGIAARTSGGNAVVSVYPTLAISGSSGTVNYTTGTSYSFVLNAENVIAGTNWAISGTLPNGLTPSSNGKTYTISGSPTQVEDREVTVTATDTKDGSTATRTLHFVGSAPASAATIRPTSMTLNGGATNVNNLYDTSKSTFVSLSKNQTLGYVFSQAVNVDTYCVDVLSTGGNSISFAVRTAEADNGAYVPVPNGDSTAYAGTITPGTGYPQPGSSTRFTVTNTTNNTMRIYAFRLGVGGVCAP